MVFCNSVARLIVVAAFTWYVLDTGVHSMRLRKQSLVNRGSSRTNMTHSSESWPGSIVKKAMMWRGEHDVSEQTRVTNQIPEVTVPKWHLWLNDDAKHVQFPPQFDTGDAFKLRRAPFEETLFVADLAPINVANPKKTRCDVPDDRGYQRCYLTSGSQHFMWTGDFEKYSTIDSMPPAEYCAKVSLNSEKIEVTFDRNGTATLVARSVLVNSTDDMGVIGMPYLNRGSIYNFTFRGCSGQIDGAGSR